MTPCKDCPSFAICINKLRDFATWKGSVVGVDIYNLSGSCEILHRYLYPYMNQEPWDRAKETMDLFRFYL